MSPTSNDNASESNIHHHMVKNVDTSVPRKKTDTDPDRENRANRTCEVAHSNEGVRKGCSSHNETNSTHPFWDTQPVPKMQEKLPDEPVGPIDSPKMVDMVRKDPYPLPHPFRWVSCDVQNPKELDDIFSLLKNNYVEDDENMFRFEYSEEFLSWCLCVPGYNKDWIVGVRTDKDKLVAFVTGIPATVSLYGTPLKVAEINFLCIHKKLRSRRLAPVLIKEVTRRVNLTNIWQAVYTAGILLTKPVAQCTYFHRSLNLKKLIEVRFALPGRSKLSIFEKLYSLPDAPQLPGLRPTERKDIPRVLELLNEKFRKESYLYPVLTEEEAAHLLLPRENVIVSHVKVNEDKTVTDFFSFYIVPSTVISNEKHKNLNAAYSFYFVATTVDVVDLIKDSLIIAKSLHMDVYNALDLGENANFIEKCKFTRGDGSLKYYVYNYLCPAMEPSKVGLVML